MPEKAISSWDHDRHPRYGSAHRAKTR